MKRLCVLLTILLSSIFICRAQRSGVAGQFNLELGGNYYSVCEDDVYYDMYGPSLSVGGGVRFCDYLYLGVAAGLNVLIDPGKDEEIAGEIVNTTWYRKFLMPIDINMRGYIPMNRTTPFYLFIDVAAGPLCHYEQYYYVDGFNMKGFHLKTGIGISYKKFTFGMGWESLQRQESVYARVGITLGRYTR